MAGRSGDGGGERRRALREERAAPGPARGGAHEAPSAPAPALESLPLPSRRDRAALRRPSVLDEPAVWAGDTTTWRSLPALQDAPTPLTPSLARSITHHLDALDTPAAPLVPAVVPRRRPAPAISGPLPAVAAQPPAPPSPASAQPSWTTGPVPTRRSRRSGAPGLPTGPAAGPPGAPRELPPPPPAAEVEAAARVRVAAIPTAPVPPPARPVSRTPGRTSVLVPPTAFTASAATPGHPATGPQTPATPLTRVAPATATAALPPETLAALRTAAAEAAAPRHPATGERSTAERSSRRRPAATTRRGATAAPGPRDRDARRWHQRRTLGVPAGVLAAAGALVVALGLSAVVVGPEKLDSVLTGAVSGSAPSGAPAPAAPEATTAAPQDTAGAAAPGAAGTDAGDGGAAAVAQPSAAGAAPAAAGAASPAGTTASTTAADAAPSQSAAATALIPTGDVTYEGFGTAPRTYVELGTEDGHDVEEGLGATFTRTAPGSAAWTGWYVGVNNQGGEGTVGCRIRDVDGRVLVEETQQEGSQLALCVLGSPAGIS